MPGAPPPPPGLPILPVPLADVPLVNCPELPEPTEGESEGLGAYAPELVTGPPPPDFATPVGADVPPIGPVAKVLPAGAELGTGTLNGVEGFATGAGADVGRALGLAVGGAGFAGAGLFVADGC